MLAQMHDDCRVCSASLHQTGRFQCVACSLVIQHCHVYDDVDNSNGWCARTDLHPRQPEQAQECAWRCHSGLRQPHVSGSAQALAHTTPAAPLLQHPQPDTGSTINQTHVLCLAFKSMFNAAQHDKHSDAASLICYINWCSCLRCKPAAIGNHITVHI